MSKRKLQRRHRFAQSPVPGACRTNPRFSLPIITRLRDAMIVNREQAVHDGSKRTERFFPLQGDPTY